MQSPSILSLLVLFVLQITFNAPEVLAQERGSSIKLYSACSARAKPTGEYRTCEDWGGWRCVELEPDEYIDESTLVVRGDPKNAAWGECATKIKTFTAIPIFPGTGLEVPREVCVMAKAKTKSGISDGRRAAMSCMLHAQVRNMGTAPLPSKSLVSDIDMPDAYRRTLIRRRDRFDMIEIAYSLPALQEMISAATQDAVSKANQIDSVNVRVSEAPESRALTVSFRVDGEARDLSADRIPISISLGRVVCDVEFDFKLGLQSLATEPALTIFNEKASCRASNDAAKLLQISYGISKGVVQSIRQMMTDDLNDDVTSLFGSSNEEPELKQLYSRAFMSGEVCAQPGGKALCVKTVFCKSSDTFANCDGGALDAHVASLVAKSPKPSGPTSDRNFLSLASEWEKLGKLKPSTKRPGLKFPAEFDGKEFHDGDTVFFGGLMCYAGNTRGCESVARSQDNNGQWHRSPDLLGYVPQKSVEGPASQFSGDQFNGVVAYIVPSRYRKQNNETLRRDYAGMLKFVDTMVRREWNPGATRFGYRFCTVAKNPFTCLAGPQEWHLVQAYEKALRARLPDLPPLLPPLATASASSYTLQVLPYEAATYPRGYRLHLIAVRLMLYRSLGVDDPILSQTAAVLAAREPENAFFLFLHLGLDRLVEDKLIEGCSKHRGQRFNQWAWQRELPSRGEPNEDEDPRYSSTMWDCGFMARLLQK